MNDSKDDVLVHTAFASSAPDRQFIERILCTEDLGHDASPDGSPESVIRFEKAEVYELAPRAYFRDLFGGRFGARGICGGYGLFEPGASLPCHFHEYDESITIVEGEATCLVEGKRYTLSGFDTAYVPKGRRHRFLNQTDRPMAMLWVYAGSDPERTIVDAGYCSGELIAE
jgi:quercetin dioxygenase-like cupin family protein